MESTSNRVGWVPAVGELYYGLNPISLDDSRTTLLERPLVNGSARFFSDFTKSKITTLPNRRWTDLSLICMCLFIFLLKQSCFRISIVDFESVWIEIGSIGLGTIWNSDRKSFSHSASEQVVSRAVTPQTRWRAAETLTYQGLHSRHIRIPKYDSIPSKSSNKRNTYM